MKKTSKLNLILTIWIIILLRAQASLIRLDVSVTSMPNCASECSYGVLTPTQCSMLDSAPCLCTDITLQKELGKCIYGACNFSDQKMATEHLVKTCKGYPVQTRSRQLINITIIMSTITFIFISMRVKSRWFDQKHLWLDDWIALVVFVFIIGAAIVQILVANAGVGDHFWNMNVNNSERIAKMLIVLQVCYNITVSATKISIMVFYHRIFMNEKFQGLCKWMVGLLILPFLVFLWLIIFRCIPMQKMWNPAKPGTCINAETMILWGAILSIAEDLIILIMPLPLISSLRIGRCEKMCSIALFGLGSFASMISLLRLKYAVKMVRHDYDKAWDLSIIIIWSVVEVDVMLICACLPAIRPLIVRCLNMVNKPCPEMTCPNLPQVAEQDQTDPLKNSLPKPMDHALFAVVPSHPRDYRERQPNDDCLSAGFYLSHAKVSRSRYSNSRAIFYQNHQFLFDDVNSDSEATISDRQFFIKYIQNYPPSQMR